MSEVGNDFIFTHIHKTGGHSVRETLRLNFTTIVRHPYHAKAEIVDRPMVFTFVRHPAFWLRSYWANRVDNYWAIGGGNGEWNKITKELNPFARDVCSEFIINVEMAKPGIVGEYFKKFFVDDIRVGRTEFLYNDLLEFLPEITRFSPKSNERVGKPQISIEAFEVASKKERWAIKSFYPDEKELLDTIWEGDVYDATGI